MNLFETSDKTGRKIHLSNERWKHISKEHPEVTSYVEEFTDVLKNPIKITGTEVDEKVKYYYNQFKVHGRYILIIVKYLNGIGFIITAYFTRKIP